MFSQFPITNSKRQTIVGIAVFTFCFWLTHGVFGKQCPNAMRARKQRPHR